MLGRLSGNRIKLAWQDECLYPGRSQGWAEAGASPKGDTAAPATTTADLVRRDTRSRRRSCRRLQAAIDEGAASGVSERDRVRRSAKLRSGPRDGSKDAARAEPEGSVPSLRHSRLQRGGVRRGACRRLISMRWKAHPADRRPSGNWRHAPDAAPCSTTRNGSGAKKDRTSSMKVGDETILIIRILHKTLWMKRWDS